MQVMLLLWTVIDCPGACVGRVLQRHCGACVVCMPDSAVMLLTDTQSTVACKQPSGVYTQTYEHPHSQQGIFRSTNAMPRLLLPGAARLG